MNAGSAMHCAGEKRPRFQALPLPSLEAGSLRIPAFPLPPEPLKSLFSGNDLRLACFLERARAISNELALASAQLLAARA